jgi:hypothetical protein
MLLYAQECLALDELLIDVHEVNNRKRIVAYCVASDKAMMLQDVYAKLQAELPEYMIPADFIFLDKLPLSPNGKVDTSALPSPVFAADTTAEPIVNALELKVALIWQEVLGLTREPLIVTLVLRMSLILLLSW